MSEPVGIIYPPPELRNLVDSTAKYVAKNGARFEEKIKTEHRNKPKFSFLLTEDPFNAYYKFKVREIRNQLLGGLDAQPAPQQQPQQDADNEQAHGDKSNVRPEPQPNEQQQQQHSNGNNYHDQDQQTQEGGDYEQESQHNEVEEGDDQRETGADSGPRVRPKLNEYIQEMTIKLEEPPTLNHLATPAPALSDRDCDIIKLTSQFIATHGRAFLLELVGREQNNSQFDFLKPQHGQFSYMTNLIMQYALIQNQPLDILEQLGKDASSQKHVLDKIKMRAEWNRMLEVEQTKRKEAEEKEKQLYAAIDWHDFVIKETIEYHPSERGEYPPTTADQVGTRLLLQQRYEEQNVPEEMEIDMDMDSDQEEEEDDEEGQSGQAAENIEGQGEFAVPHDLMPPKPDQVVIRRDYDPKSTGSKGNQLDNYFVSPITNERIPVDKIHEHMKYNLSDPRHLEKKGQMLQEKMNEESVYPSGSQITSNLKNFSERRTDIFGLNDKETAIGLRIGEEEQAPPKENRLIWDGHKSSLKKRKLG